LIGELDMKDENISHVFLFTSKTSSYLLQK